MKQFKIGQTVTGGEVLEALNHNHCLKTALGKIIKVELGDFLRWTRKTWITIPPPTFMDYYGGNWTVVSTPSKPELDWSGVTFKSSVINLFDIQLSVATSNPRHLDVEDIYKRAVKCANYLKNFSDDEIENKAVFTRDDIEWVIACTTASGPKYNKQQIDAIFNYIKTNRSGGKSEHSN